MFLIAGGPGQGSRDVFGLGEPSTVAMYRQPFPGYTLVAYDDRGTGTSGLLDCPALQAAPDGHRGGAGRRRARTRSARAGPLQHDRPREDLEAVRAALGFDKIGLYGTSYGTKLALAYASPIPHHVERLLLDSVLPPEFPDPFEANVLSAMPATLDRFCANGSLPRRDARTTRATSSPWRTRSPRSRCRRGAAARMARTATVHLVGLDLLSMVLDSDLNPGLAAELPAVVHAARLGNPQPLLRLYQLDSQTSAEPAPELSSALYAATVCHDGPFPWAPDTPIRRPAGDGSGCDHRAAARLARRRSARGRPSSATPSFCLDWPSPSGGVVYGAGPYPDVPMLAVSGGYDMRTPTPGAVSVAAQFPQGHVLVVPGVGHSVLGADASGCSQRAVRSWMLGGAVPATCARPAAFVAARPPIRRRRRGPRHRSADSGDRHARRSRTPRRCG